MGLLSCTKENPPNVFTVEVLPCEGGSVGPYSTISVTSGSNLNFTLTPEFGFKPDSIIVNGLSIPLTGNTFSLTNITSDTKIKGVFVKIQSWYLIQKPWKWFKWEVRTVNTVDWWNQILPRDIIYIFTDQYKFQKFVPPELVGDGLYILKQDSLIIGPNAQTLKDGVRNKIILLTADTLKLVHISKFYESGRPVPELNMEVQETYVH